MLGIEINGEFLDLLPGAALERQQENTFLQFSDTLVGEYSLPFQAPATARNLRLLNYAAVFQNSILNTGINAILYDNNVQVGSGKIKIERANIDLNKTGSGIISCYFLSGSSGFWQDIKDIKLRSIAVGGDRSFAWDNFNMDGAGFWGHIHAVAEGAIGDFDYAFFSVMNNGWLPGYDTAQIMNNIEPSVGSPHPVQFTELINGPASWERNRIVPMPYLKYVLTKTFEHVGWTVAGDILTDADFIKVCMINFRAINWCGVALVSGTMTTIPNDPVIFNLQDHLPDITIAAFLIALKNRFGWYYDFDNTTKVVTIKTLQSLTGSAVKDMTGKSSPILTKTIAQEKPIYALRNNFATDIANGAPDFRVIQYTPVTNDVDKTTDLPTATEALYGHVYLVREENNFYICQQNPDDETWQWYLYTPNIYDYEPDGANADIITDATVVGQERLDNYYDLIPRIDNQGEWMGSADNAEPSSWGIHLVFYFGKRDNKSAQPLLYASHHLYDSQGYTLAAWSLAFRGEKTATHDQVGLYDKSWKDFITMISGAEEIEHTLYLPMHEYLKLKFSDRINIAGVQLFVKQITSSIPYNGRISCTSIRV